MKQLDLEFLSSAGKVQHVKLKYVNENLTEETVRSAMNDLSELKLFKKDDIEMYAKPLAARYVETIHQSIFEDKAEKVTEV